MRRMTLLPVLAGPALLVALGYGATVVAPATADVTTTRTDATREHSVAGAKGRGLYGSNGCVYCHTRQVRDAFTDADLAAGPSSAGEGLNDVPGLQGQARYGPDLACAGDRVPGAEDGATKEQKVAAMVEYLKDPAAAHPGSTMPSYRHLVHRDLERLAAFLVEHTCEESE
ncbi:MAG TPA: cbb3-type cytochrome c oxidase subunit II [Frankiaceae bacterium]|jgi:cytochrome c oxidase cbb3-type subunit 2|nr:cbb3-type cytochrome c oxidase subunit II [Frankiaceae bacterium]